MFIKCSTAEGKIMASYDKRILTKVAHMYYDEDMTQQEIADKLEYPDLQFPDSCKSKTKRCCRNKNLL